MIKQVIQKALRPLGYEIRRTGKFEYFAAPVEFEKTDVEIFRYVFKNKLTGVSPERLIATIQACKYAVLSDIDGDFVECGVWRGGNAIAAKLVFEAYGSDKSVILFDTFAGMTEPTEFDKTEFSNLSAQVRFARSRRDNYNDWAYASLDDVKRNFENASIDTRGVKYVEGDVIDTLAARQNLPSNISVLRLDTDWYESTKAEMNALYPLLSPGGALLIDDYGHWQGARKAIEEYFEINGDQKCPLLQYTDYTGRMGIKR